MRGSWTKGTAVAQVWLDFTLNDVYARRVSEPLNRVALKDAPSLGASFESWLITKLVMYKYAKSYLAFLRTLFNF